MKPDWTWLLIGIALGYLVLPAALGMVKKTA
jgi:uncharacterized membrane protein YkvA (DUF1232 family)